MEEKERKIKELEEAIKKSEQEKEMYKNIGKGKSREEILQLSNQMKELESKNQSLKAEYQSKITTLEEENNAMIEENDKLTIKLNSISVQNDKEKAQLTIENEALLKQIKEFQNKLNYSRSDPKEVEQLKSNSIKLQDQLNKYDQDLATAKVSFIHMYISNK